MRIANREELSGCMFAGLGGLVGFWLGGTAYAEHVRVMDPSGTVRIDDGLVSLATMLGGMLVGATCGAVFGMLVIRILPARILKRFHRQPECTLDWYEVSSAVHSRTFDQDGDLSSLPTEWEREVAALWRLEADVNNGAYLQFLGNWRRETYESASRALKNVGARRMARLIDACQALVDEHLDCSGKSAAQLYEELPEEISARILDLSYQFMAYPDDLPRLALKRYGQLLTAGRTKELDLP
jgi:hypothetical protein